MSTTGTVKGTVKNPSGQPEAGATVEVKGTDLIGISAEDGAYQIDDVPTGKQTIVASMVIAKQSREVDVPAHSVATVDFVIKPLN